jgi:hypothetical protein
METLFRTLSRLRGKRIVHPFGVGFAGRLIPLGEGGFGAAALERETEIVVRLSRALGLPEGMPDLWGLAIRIPDAYGTGRHQDLLLVTSAAPPGGRHALLPSRGVCGLPYSTVLPYRVGGRTVLLGARALAPGPGPGLAELRERERGQLRFELKIAELGRKWKPVARLSLGKRLPPELTERLDFDPTNTGGGLHLAGYLNRLRGPSYRASQAGREAAYARSAIPK